MINEKNHHTISLFLEFLPEKVQTCYRWPFKSIWCVCRSKPSLIFSQILVCVRTYMRQISLRVRAASSAKWGSTVNTARWEGFTTRCILPVCKGLFIDSFRKGKTLQFSFLFLTSFYPSSGPAAAAPCPRCDPEPVPTLSSPFPVLVSSSRQQSSLSTQHAATTPSFMQRGGRWWKCYVASFSTLTISN